MKKIKFLEIGEHVYPLSFSLGAIKRISQKYGGLEAFNKKLGKMDIENEEGIDNVTEFLELLSYQGAQYMNVIEKGNPPIEGADLDENGKYRPISKERIELLLDMDGIIEVTNIITEITGGEKNERTAPEKISPEAE